MARLGVTWISQKTEHRSKVTYLVLVGVLIIGACATTADSQLTTINSVPTTIGKATTTTESYDSIPIIIDTDVALDDVMAILYLLRLPELDIRAITVSGTGIAHCQAGVSIVLGLLAVSSVDGVPVSCGSESPLEGSNSVPEPWRDGMDAMAGSGIFPDGGDPASKSASEVIYAAARTSPVPPVMIVLGPHTNLAQALRESPDLEDLLDSVHAMGGAVDVTGNAPENMDAELNFWLDPVAVAEVMATGLPFRIVPLDATNAVPLTTAFADALAANLETPESEAAYAALTFDPGTLSFGGLHLWDQLAVAAFVRPELLDWQNMDLTIFVTGGPSSEGSLGEGLGRPVRAAIGADREAFETEYLMTLTGHDVVVALPEADGKIVFDGTECVSSIPDGLPGGGLTAEISNESENLMTFVIGTYQDGYGREDLVAFIEELEVIAEPPPFIEILEFHELGSGSDGNYVFSLGDGLFFMLCLQQPSTALVLDDVVVGDPAD